MYSLPIIKVRDKETGRIHIVGSDVHDRLYIDSNGSLIYYNLQNGCGTPTTYEFIGNGIDECEPSSTIKFETVEGLNSVVDDLLKENNELQALRDSILSEAFESAFKEENKCNCTNCSCKTGGKKDGD